VRTDEYVRGYSKVPAYACKKLRNQWELVLAYAEREKEALSRDGG